MLTLSGRLAWRLTLQHHLLRPASLEHSVWRLLRVVCRSWRGACDDDRLWLKLLSRDLSRGPVLPSSATPGGHSSLAPGWTTLWQSRPDVLHHHRAALGLPASVRGGRDRGDADADQVSCSPNPDSSLWSGGGPRFDLSGDCDHRARYVELERLGRSLAAHRLRFTVADKHDTRVTAAVESAGGWAVAAEPGLIRHWLSWMHDLNWPSASAIARVLRCEPAAAVMAPFYREALEEWHARDLFVVLLMISEQYHASFEPVLRRMSERPTDAEVEEDVRETASEILEEHAARGDAPLAKVPGFFWYWLGK